VPVDKAGSADWTTTPEADRGTGARAEVRPARLRREGALRRDRVAPPLALQGSGVRGGGPSRHRSGPRRRLRRDRSRAPQDPARRRHGPGGRKRHPAGPHGLGGGPRGPVDPQGSFVAEEVLPPGAHTVEVAVLDDAGNGSLYLAISSSRSATSSTSAWRTSRSRRAAGAGPRSSSRAKASSSRSTPTWTGASRST
jgi:hypothetical protein